MIETMTLFGPAEATKVAAGRVQVRLMDGTEGRASLALAVPYDPKPGDRLLVIGQEPDDLYVIGVLQGSGTTALRVPANLALEAPNGRITLSAGAGVTIESPATVEMRAPLVSLQAGKLEVIAQRILQRAKDVTQWIAGLLEVKSHKIRTTVADAYHLKANRAYVKAEREVFVDGETINLG